MALNRTNHGRMLAVRASATLLLAAIWASCSSVDSGRARDGGAGRAGSPESPSGGAESAAGAEGTPGGVAAVGGAGQPAAGGAGSSNEGGTPASSTPGGQGVGGPAPGSAGTSGAGGEPAGGEVDGTLIGNGDFSAGMEGWDVMMTGGAVTVRYDSGRLCVEAGDALSQVVVGWPYAPYVPITLEPGVPYTFSFRAVGTRAIQILAKLGLVTPSYTPYATQIVETSGSWQSFSSSFSLNSGSQSIGVAISFTLAPLDSVCLDDVVVTTP